MTDIKIDIIDMRAKVPGTDLYPWQMREKNPGWEPGPDHPRIQAAALPSRRSSTADHVNHVFKTATRKRQPGSYDPLPTTNPTIQFLGRKTMLDLRRWGPGWNEATRKNDGPEQCGGGNTGSLFLNTVHYCFADHYPLGIRPEALMYMVTHEVGVTVKQHPDSYRSLFTTSAEKQLISVQVDELDIDDPESPWHLGVQRIREVLDQKVPSDLMRHCLPGFTTDNLESSTAQVIAFMDAASPYYDYLMRTCCGIPKIRLFGEPEDYRRLLSACEKLAGYFQEHLGTYFEHLLPVLRKILAQVDGTELLDQDFWSSIYNHYSGSGTDDMDGWITAFVNYEFHGGKFVQKDAELFDWKQHMKDCQGKWGSGIARDVMPTHLSCVPFLWQYAKDHPGRAYKQEGGVVFDCRLVGGFLGVEDIDGYATPVLSYAVLRGDELEQQRKGEGPDQQVVVQRDGGDPVSFARGNLTSALDNSGYNS